MLVLKEGKIIIGDGKTILEKASIIIQDSLIVDILEKPLPLSLLNSAEVIDVKGDLMIPGVVNNHVHCVVEGPRFASGAKSLSYEEVVNLLNTHLLQGTTTITNVDGFVNMDEVDKINKLHPMNVKQTTHHIPECFKAALLLDGSGLKKKHLEMSVEKMLTNGAVAIGEIGGGQTLGGGGQDYMYIPQAVKKRIGKKISVATARSLKFAVLGRFLNISAFNPIKVAQVLKENNLDKYFTVEEAKSLIVNTTLPTINITLQAYEKAAKLAKRYHVPLIVHNAPPSMEKVFQISSCGLNNLLIAAHSNYLFTMDEAIKQTRRIKKNSAIIDTCAFDSFGKKTLVASPEIFFALLKENLGDMIMSDYSAGHHDSILLALEKAVEGGYINLCKAIALATSCPAEAIPKSAPNRGILKKRAIADIVITDKNKISKVRVVIIGGKLVVKNSKMCF